MTKLAVLTNCATFSSHPSCEYINKRTHRRGIKHVCEKQEAERSKMKFGIDRKRLSVMAQNRLQKEGLCDRTDCTAT